jgi:hypothetical protein
VSDATYQPKVYRDQGGNRINIVSGGTLSVESGAVCSLAGVVRHSLIHTAVSTQASAINAGGLTNLNATAGTSAGTVHEFHLAAPGAAGVVTYLAGGALGSTAMSVSTTGAGLTIGAAGTAITFTKNTYGGATLVSSATGRWELVEAYGANVAIS